MCEEMAKTEHIRLLWLGGWESEFLLFPFLLFPSLLRLRWSTKRLPSSLSSQPPSLDPFRRMLLLPAGNRQTKLSFRSSAGLV